MPRAARKWLAEKAGVAENRIVLMGESLGGAVAVDLAGGRSAGLGPGKHVQLHAAMWPHFTIPGYRSGS